MGRPRDTMHRAKPMGLEETHYPPGADDRRKPIAHRARSNVRGLFWAILCGVACGCGGGGGSSSGSSSGNPPPPPTSATLLAVTNATTGTIDILTIDTKTGTPTPIAGNPLPDGPTPSAVAIGPQKRFLYVTSTSGEIRGYLIDPSTLKLTAVGGSPFATSAQSVAIAIDPSGQFVLTANGSSNTVSVFKIGSTGALTEVAGSPFAAGSDPSALIVAAGKYVYAANTAGHGVSAFSINAGTGALTAIPGSPFAASYAIQSPVMDAEGKRLHAANGTDVDCFLVDANSAALTEIGLSSTNGRAIALALDGSDNFLYVLDNVANQIEVFSIDPTGGSLALIAGSPFALFSGASNQSLGPNAIAEGASGDKRQ